MLIRRINIASRRSLSRLTLHDQGEGGVCRHPVYPVSRQPYRICARKGVAVLLGFPISSSSVSEIPVVGQGRNTLRCSGSEAHSLTYLRVRGHLRSDRRGGSGF